ncbi:MAG: mechanosensitive ion channel family protein [Reyranellaceae bacterium]
MDVDVWIDTIAASLRALATAWTAYQAAIAVACAALAFGLTRLIEPRIEARLRRISGQPRLLRALVVVTRRMQWILLAVGLWIAVGVLHDLTEQANGHLLRLAARLATAWVVISILSRVIQSRPRARFVAIVGWIVAALFIVGWLEPAKHLLDSAGFSIGERRLSLLTLLYGLAVLAVALWFAAVAGTVLEQRLRTSELLTPSAQVLAAKFAKAAMIFAAIAMALSAVGFDLTALTVFSGAFGLGLALSLQKVASNLMSGVIILMDRSIKPGDVIQLGSTFGWISSLRARYVSVITRDGAEYLIPNETFVTEQVINWSYSDRRIRQEVRFGVTYDCDPHEVRRFTSAAVAKVNRVLSTPAPVCHLVEFGDSSLNFVLRFWIEDPEEGLMNVKGQAMLAVWDALKEHGVGIPYPHREIIVRDGRPPAAGT